MEWSITMLKRSQMMKGTKVLHSGELFYSVNEFLTRQLPTKRQVTQRIQLDCWPKKKRNDNIT